MINMHKFNMIVAADEDWCIGKNGTLLVSIPEDMKFFREKTNGKTVIMGETTQESLPNSLYLKGRINIVLTNKLKTTKEVHFYEDDTIVYYASNIDEVYEFIDEINNANANNDDIYNNRYIDDDDVFIIGGGQTYKYFLENDLVQSVYLTRIHHNFHGDTFIPDISKYGFTNEVVVTPLTQSSNTGYYYSIAIYRKNI